MFPMLTPREYCRITAAGFVLVGVSCFPIGVGVNPKRDRSLFFQVADTGVWFRLGIILVLVGAVLFLIACLLPDR